MNVFSFIKNMLTAPTLTTLQNLETGAKQCPKPETETETEVNIDDHITNLMRNKQLTYQQMVDDVDNFIKNSQSWNN